MKVRQADQNDYTECLKIVPQAWRNSGFDARLGERLFHDYVFVALDESKTIVGFLVCDSTFFDNDGFYLRTLVVADNAQKKNVGELLSLKATKWAFASGARRVFVDVVDDALGKALAKEGFERVGEIKHMHGEGSLFQIYSLQVGAKDLDKYEKSKGWQ